MIYNAFEWMIAPVGNSAVFLMTIFFWYRARKSLKLVAFDLERPSKMVAWFSAAVLTAHIWLYSLLGSLGII